MLVELTVRDLGVIDDLSLTFGPGMTALTGETGAGKTLVVEAIELLVGGRADGALVRPGAAEAWVEGRFVDPDGREVILARAVPAEGRSRGYVDGRMAGVSTLTEVGERLVDLHGQHAHQSLLSPAVQRRALDLFGRVDRSDLDRARSRVREIEAGLVGLGGDARARARETDLLRFQVNELETARLSDPLEEATLEADESVLGQASTWREAAAAAVDLVDGDGGAGETVSSALALLRGRTGDSPFGAAAHRLAAVLAELTDVAGDVRVSAEAIVDDPERLASIQARRHLLRELRRKYGETLADVIAFESEARLRLDELQSYEQRAGELEAERSRAAAEIRSAAAAVASARRAAAPALADQIETHLRVLALPKARFSVDVDGEDPADDVVFGFCANPGEPVLPLAKVASGGELARTMLAARLVLTAGPPTLVFDEVDAGVGGEAASVVGRALARIVVEPGRQVLVVTHLAQVAAFADAQVAVVKVEEQARTVARAAVVDGEDRVRELSRMMSGQPESDTARSHAAELLALAGRERRATRAPGFARRRG